MRSSRLFTAEREFIKRKPFVNILSTEIFEWHTRILTRVEGQGVTVVSLAGLIEAKRHLAACLLLALVAFLPSAASATEISSCQTLSTADTYTLTTNVTSLGTCFTVGDHNVVLDCNGFGVIYGNTAGTQGKGILDSGYDNLTVNNCVFQQGAGTINKVAIYLADTENAMIKDSNATSTSGWAIFIGGPNGLNNTVNNTRIQSWQNIGVYINNSNYNNISYSNFSIGNGAGDYGIYAYNDSSYNTFYMNNIVSSTDNSIRLYGVTTGSNYNNVSNNTMRSTAGYSIYAYASSYNNIINNSITATTTGAVQIQQYSLSNNFSYNNVTAGDGVNDYGIFILDYSDSNFFTGNIVGATAQAVYIAAQASSSNNFTNNNFNSSAGSGFYLISGESTYVSDNNIETGVTGALYGVYVQTASNGVFTNNYIRSRSSGSSYGMRFTASANGNTIYNNTINTSVGLGIQMDADVASNNITGNTINATTAGVYFSATSDSIVDSNIFNVTAGYMFQAASSSNNNNITNNTAMTNTYAAYITASTGNNFSNNIVVSRANYGIYILSSSSDNYFENNYISSLYATGGQLVNIAGTTGGTFRNNTFSSHVSTAVQLTTASSFLFDSNNITTNASGLQAIQITTTASWNNFTNNNITSLSSYAVYLPATATYNKFTNNSILTNLTTAVGLLGASNYNVFDGNTIQSGVNTNAYGVYIDNSDYNNFTNSNVSSRSKNAANTFALYITAAGDSKFNYFENDTFFSNFSYGIYLVTNVFNTTFKNVTVVSNESIGVRLSTSARNNTFEDCSITSWESQAGYLDTQTSTNNSFTNCGFYNYYTPTTLSTLYLYQASGNSFKNISVNAPANTNARGVWFTGTAGIGADNNRFYNSTITATGTNGYDVYSDVDSDNYFLNVTYNTFDAFFNDGLSSLNISWYLNVSVKDGGGSLVPYANATIVDNNGYVWFNSTTDAFGYITPIGVVQYLQTDESVTNSSTPYNITAFKGSIWNTATQAVTGNVNVDVTLSGLSTCGSLSTNTTLLNDVYAGGTCFTIAANYLTLNCAGYAINFSRTSSGYAFNATSRTNFTAANCTFFQGAQTGNSSAAYILNSPNTTIANSSFNTINSSHVYASRSDPVEILSSPLNASRVTVASSALLRARWYEDVRVLDFSANAVEEANVTFYNTSGSYIVSHTTNSSGSTPLFLLTQYEQSDSATTYATNYSINVSYGSITNSTYLNITGNTSTTVTLNATSCGALSSNYTLTNNVLASATCFTVGAANIVLDCGGYLINYSRTSAGYGVNSTGYNTLTVKSCNITRGGTDSSAYAILLNASNSSTIANSTLNSSNATAIYMVGATGTAIINTTINVSSGTNQIEMDSASSNASRYWYATVHVIGLANEDVASSAITVVNNQSGTEATGSSNSTGYRTFTVREYVQDSASTTYYAPLNYSATHPTTLQTNSTVDNTTQSKDITVQVISAEINITSPYTNDVYLQGQNVNITVNETRGLIWVTNVTITVTNDDLEQTYQATEAWADFWQYTYAIDPAMTSRTLYITATGYNDTTNVTDTDQFIVTRSTGGGITQPTLTNFCANQTYSVAGEMVSVNVTADLDTVLYAITANVTYPNATTATLTQSGSTVSDEVNYIYSALFNFTLPDEGNYTVGTSARDVNDNTASNTIRIVAVSSDDSVSFNTSGASYFTILDSCSSTPLANSSANGITTTIPAGLYKVTLYTEKPEITFNNASLNSTLSGTAFKYDELESVTYTVPSNRRYVRVFNVSTNGTEYSDLQVYYNYTPDEATLVAQASLEFQKCEEVNSTCTWNSTSVTTGLNTTTNNITGYANSSSLWAVLEPAYTEPETNTVYITRTETGTVVKEKDVFKDKEKIVEKFVSTHLIQNPPEIEVYETGTASVEVQLRNDGTTTFEDIKLAAISSASQITASLSSDTIPKLEPGQTTSVRLTASSSNAPLGSYSIALSATSGDYSEAVSVPVAVVKFLKSEKLEAQRQIEFGLSLAMQNQECREFADTLDQANKALKDGDAALALRLANDAIAGCKQALALAGTEAGPLTGLFAGRLLQGDWANSAVIGAVGAVIALTLVLLKKLVTPKRKEDEIAKQLADEGEAGTSGAQQEYSNKIKPAE